MSSLAKGFNEYFEVVPADTDQLLQEAYRIRYQVYCLEVGLQDFEIDKFPDGIEKDIYDQRSVHSLLYHKPSGEYAGTVRLVLADPSNPDLAFPIEEFTSHTFDPALIQPSKLPRAHTAEISRLMVKHKFRSRHNNYNCLEKGISSESNQKKDIRQLYYPFMGLLLAIMRMTKEHSVTHWYAGMEPSLNKLLAKLGLQLAPIGPLVEYHGVRQPHMGLVSKVIDSIYYAQRDVWGLITDEGSLMPPPRELQETGIKWL